MVFIFVVPCDWLNTSACNCEEPMVEFPRIFTVELRLVKHWDVLRCWQSPLGRHPHVVRWTSVQCAVQKCKTQEKQQSFISYELNTMPGIVILDLLSNLK